MPSLEFLSVTLFIFTTLFSFLAYLTVANIDQLGISVHF